MTIDTNELLRYINIQEKTFDMLPFKSDFNEGIKQGFNLMKCFIEVYESREGKSIAEALDGKK